MQGDDERLAEALAEYPEDEVDTVFLGDFFQGGRRGAGGGAAAAQRARSRRNSVVVLGNHDVFILAVLEARRGAIPVETFATYNPQDIEDYWLDRRGDPADLSALMTDPGLEAWLRGLPLMAMLGDGTLAQHTDHDAYLAFGDSVDAINARAATEMANPAGLFTVFERVVGRRAFDDAARLDAYLKVLGARRVIHGHTPHWQDAPLARHGGRVIGYDGSFSRFWARGDEKRSGPITATVALLPPLPASGQT